MSSDCQDDFVGDASLGGDPKAGIFAVADGHGPNGRRVSQLLVKDLGGAITAELDPKLPVEKALKRAYLKLNVQLLKSQARGMPLRDGTRRYMALHAATCRCMPLRAAPPPHRPTAPPLHRPTAQIDCAISGSTCLTVLLHGGRAYAANVGDSRCVAAMRAADGSLEAVDWTVDQKPGTWTMAARAVAREL